MKHDNKGETAKGVNGTCSMPKSTPNHPSITNAGTSGKEVSGNGPQNSILNKLPKK
jgi:hypothetical protein